MWETDCLAMGPIEFKQSRRRKKRRKAQEPVVALYAKTHLIETQDPVLGDGCEVIVVE